MSTSSTAMKLAGLMVALGLFGMGPGTSLLEEFKASLERKRDERHEKDAATVAPPGEKKQAAKQKQKQEHNHPHILEGASVSPSCVQKRPTSYVSQEAAHDFVTHPYQHVSAPSTNTSSTPTTAKIPITEDAKIPSVTPRPTVGGTAMGTVIINKTTPAEGSHNYSIPWLNFMMSSNNNNRKD